jgi:hypothetical protein
VVFGQQHSTDAAINGFIPSEKAIEFFAERDVSDQFIYGNIYQYIGIGLFLNRNWGFFYQIVIKVLTLAL